MEVEKLSFVLTNVVEIFTKVELHLCFLSLSQCSRKEMTVRRKSRGELKGM